MYYNEHGQQIDIYGRVLTPAPPPRQQFPPRQPYPMQGQPLVQPPPMQEQPKSEWEMEAPIKKQDNTWDFLNMSSDDYQFKKIDNTTNVQDAHNKDAWLGETIYMFNAETGQLFKKYVDFSIGKLIIEIARFEKPEEMQVAPVVYQDDRYDELAQTVISLQRELEELKNAKTMSHDLIATTNESKSKPKAKKQEEIITLGKPKTEVVNDG